MLASAATRIDRFRQSQGLRLVVVRRKRLGIRIGLLVGGSLSIATVLSASRGGCSDSLAWLLESTAIAALFVGGLGLLLCLSPRLRPLVLGPIAASLTTLVLLFFTVFPLEPLREAALFRMATSAEPVVLAIRSYEERHAAPPPTLDALVPEFLAELPRSTFWCPANLVYSPKPLDEESARDWTLRVPTPDGYSLVYLPASETPRWFLPGTTTCGDWVHIYVD